jgi:L-alanine-DL-glutamate epimerase-like enolase superfamily enzyme
MRILAVDMRAVRVNRRGDWLFVLLRTDEGMTGVGEASHGGSGPVALAASLQAAALLPSFRILEYAWGEVPWRAGLVTPAEQIAGGEIQLPQAPGLGVQLDEATAAEHAVEI